MAVIALDFIDRPLTQHQPLTAGPGRYHVQQRAALGAFVAVLRSLAVDGDQVGSSSRKS
jgi:hypothetical protein